jgi:hypothetical protein
MGMLRSKPLFASDSFTYLLLESALIAVAIWLGYEIRFSFSSDYSENYADHFISIIVTIIVIQTTLYYNGLYEKKPYRTVEAIFKLLFSLLIAAGCLTVCYYLFPILKLGRGVFVISLGICAILLTSVRLIQIYLFGSGKIGQRIIILGTGDRAMHIARLISQKKGRGYTLLGFVESDKEWMSRESYLAKGNKPMLTLMSGSPETDAGFPESDPNRKKETWNTASHRRKDTRNGFIKRLWRVRGACSAKVGNRA